MFLHGGMGMMKIVAFDNKELLLYFASYYVDESGKKCVNLFHPDDGRCC